MENNCKADVRRSDHCQQMLVYLANSTVRIASSKKTKSNFGENLQGKATLHLNGKFEVSIFVYSSQDFISNRFAGQ